MQDGAASLLRRHLALSADEKKPEPPPASPARFWPLCANTIPVPAPPPANPTPTATILNGIRIQRLKNKFGTQSLPTDELVLENTRGWLIGQERQDVEEISSILTLTRIYSTVAA
ncbi:hypothetical protein E4U57_005383 [Claviceps arundinis]|uniref:Uncharacterized protein n=1 Tax=Claviceps arundinis TaxID=1623583 RepID=A0ABQ7PJS8_9HYPO|nr:hypothetical protein E4U57_005383 [Claviceps arundinis]